MPPQPISKRALVIDDDPMSRELLEILLEGEGYAVDSADSGESALDLVGRSTSTPDLVLSDVQLPGISGASLARKLRRVCGSGTLLLAMSGSQPPAKAVSLFDGFLMKPFKMQQVSDAVDAAKKQTSVPAPATRIARRAKSVSPAVDVYKRQAQYHVQEVKRRLLQRQRRIP